MLMTVYEVKEVHQNISKK